MEKVDEKRLEELKNKNTIVLVDCFAEWCSPCKFLKTQLEVLEEDYNNIVKFVKVDIEENDGIAKSFSIRSVPTVLIFKNGELVRTSVGMKTNDYFRSEIEKLLNE